MRTVLLLCAALGGRPHNMSALSQSIFSQLHLYNGRAVVMVVVRPSVCHECILWLNDASYRTFAIDDYKEVTYWLSNDMKVIHLK